MKRKVVAACVLLTMVGSSLSYATDAAPLYGEAAAKVVMEIKNHMNTTHVLLTQIYDAQTAAMYAPRVESALNEIKKTDLSAFANEDEECLAAEFTDSFNSIIIEVERLIKEKFYNDATLKKLFGHFMENHDEGAIPSQLIPMAEYMMLTE